MQFLTAQELIALVERVFKPTPEETHLAILVDLPNTTSDELPHWLERRQIAWNWYQTFAQAAKDGLTNLECRFYLYPAVGANNGDLPENMWDFHGEQLPLSAAELSQLQAIATTEVFSTNQLILAPTQYSATAPLKLNAPKFQFKAATLPGFSTAMIPALKLDYLEVARRVMALSEVVSASSGALIKFQVEGMASQLELFIDLRHRFANSSTGLLRHPGMAGNVPSGESYIVPYEGEREGIPSRTHGIMPVQFGAEMIFYQIENNHAIGVIGTGPKARQEASNLRDEPAYGNIAELGLGVLGGFNIAPIGEILLDEKLGLHIAFGRSDHFTGGTNGASKWHDPSKMVHIDRVYVKGLQPSITIASCQLEMADGSYFDLMKDGEYCQEIFATAC